jgi:hypothetical protein
MIKLIDGPAAGTVLMLKRGPMFLRAVVNSKGQWDALDQPEETVASGEVPHCYVASDQIGMCHIRSGKRGVSGFYAMGNYRLAAKQPSVEVMSDNAKWRAWCDANRDQLVQVVKP